MAKQISPLPTPPTRSSPADFSARADAFLGALPGFQSQANEVAAEAEANASTATSKATAAAGSATAAANSATAAAGSATAANSSKTAAATSETNAAAAKDAAKASETNAAASASAAAASEANAAASKTAAAGSATAANSSKTAAATSETNAASSKTAAANSANAAAGSATTAAGSASAAANSSTAAANSASDAANSATAAAASQDAAKTSETNAAASLTNFDNKWMGVRTSEPATASEGALYFNSTTAQMYVRRSGAWAVMATGQTATDIRNALLTVDGPNSGVDADLLDGLHNYQFPILSEKLKVWRPQVYAPVMDMTNIPIGVSFLPLAAPVTSNKEGVGVFGPGFTIGADNSLTPVSNAYKNNPFRSTISWTESGFDPPSGLSFSVRMNQWRTLTRNDNTITALGRTSGWSSISNGNNAVPLGLRVNNTSGAVISISGTTTEKLHYCLDMAIGYGDL